MEPVAPHEALSMLRDAVSALLSCDTSALSAPEFAGFMTDVETHRRRLEAVDHRTVAAAEERRLAGEFGATSTADWLVDLLRVSPGEARTRVRRARDLGPRRNVQGELLEPIFAVTASAQRAGSISAAHARVVVRTLDALPPAAAVAHHAGIEKSLVDFAQRLDPTRLNAAALRILAHVTPDGDEPREKKHDRERNFEFRVRDDGSFDFGGRGTPELLATVRPVIDALCAPQDTDECTDTRTPTQRRHDALLEVFRRMLRSGTLPDSGGTVTTILAWIHADDLAQRAGAAETEFGQTIATADLLRMATEAEVVPVVMNAAGGIMSYGRTRRFASPGQRRALALRDRGCCFPGCRRPASWTEAHHTTPWSEGGTTDIDQMCLLCSFHHHSFEELGWAVVMIDGVPQWIPPAWIDPERRPRRNVANHLPEFDFGSAA